MYVTCKTKDCHFTFLASSESVCCPECGGKVRQATEKEMSEKLEYLKNKQGA